VQPPGTNLISRFRTADKRLVRLLAFEVSCSFVRSLSHILMGVLFLCLTAFPMFAQNTAELRGTVTDATGGVLPGVSVILINKGSGQERSQLTDSGGSYIFATLPNGGYALKAELSGFRTLIRDSIMLQGGQHLNLDLSLSVSTINEEVTV